MFHVASSKLKKKKTNRLFIMLISYDIFYGNFLLADLQFTMYHSRILTVWNYHWLFFVNLIIFLTSWREINVGIFVPSATFGFCRICFKHGRDFYRRNLFVLLHFILPLTSYYFYFIYFILFFYVILLITEWLV
jgi:hypothetical protein